MKKNEPIRHHYIPQFILRNFCSDDSGKLFYHDRKTDTVSMKEPRDIFMGRNLYRDEPGHPDDPVQIEQAFSHLENQAAKIIKSRFLTEREITLTDYENELLKWFFALMGFRSQNTASNFCRSLSPESKAFYRQFQPDGNFEAMWKRNLSAAAECKTLSEALSHPDIDQPFRIFFQRDACGYLGTYFAVGDSSDAESFLLSDAYPTVISGTLPNQITIQICSIYPISPSRVLFLACDWADGTPTNLLNMRPLVLTPPRENSQDHSVTIRVKKLTAYEVDYLNHVIQEEAKIGIISSDR